MRASYCDQAGNLGGGLRVGHSMGEPGGEAEGLVVAVVVGDPGAGHDLAGAQHRGQHLAGLSHGTWR